MPSSPRFKSRIAAGAAALGLLGASPVSAAPTATPTASTKGNACSAILRSLSPRERHYVVGIMSLTYTQLAAAFGTSEVRVSARPIDACESAGQGPTSETGRSQSSFR
jgi:hypothetical protein